MRRAGGARSELGSMAGGRVAAMGRNGCLASLEMWSSSVSVLLHTSVVHRLCVVSPLAPGSWLVCAHHATAKSGALSVVRPQATTAQPVFRCSCRASHPLQFAFPRGQMKGRGSDGGASARDRKRNRSRARARARLRAASAENQPQPAPPSCFLKLKNPAWIHRLHTDMSSQWN